MPQDRDRRRHKRIGLEAYAALESTGRFANDQAFGIVLDISRSGIRFRTGQPPHVGQVVDLHVGVGEDIRTLRANVIRVSERSRNLYDSGLSFSRCTIQDIALLVQHFETVCADD